MDDTKTMAGTKLIYPRLCHRFTGLRYFKVSASWEDYFLEDDPMLVKTEEFKDIFGNDNFAAVLTRCDNSFTKENLELIRELTNEMMDSLSYADKITSLTDVEFMVGSEEGMTIEQIVPRNNTVRFGATRRDTPQGLPETSRCRTARFQRRNALMDHTQTAYFPRRLGVEQGEECCCS